MGDDRANIKVSREFYEEHKDRKAPGQTWEEYIEGEAPDPGEQYPVLATADDLEELAALIEQIPDRTAKELEDRLR